MTTFRSWCRFLALEFHACLLNSFSAMPLHPESQQLIRQVEELSGRMVQVTEDSEIKVMATISTARGTAPAHFLRYRPDTRAEEQRGARLNRAEVNHV